MKALFLWMAPTGDHHSLTFLVELAQHFGLGRCLATASPFPLRFLFANDPNALSAVLNVVHRAISTFVVRHSGFTVSSGARTGAVTLIQRFGSALNLNVHLHMLFLDGACRLSKSHARD